LMHFFSLNWLLQWFQVVFQLISSQLWLSSLT
jgi:hypothetical protein